ncbi:MAG: hypothetical protein R8P61_00785 [Bacteroidia bacterium]|nr:hypothetical protein [Bacteroidia bacterium]
MNSYSPGNNFQKLVLHTINRQFSRSILLSGLILFLLSGNISAQEYQQSIGLRYGSTKGITYKAFMAEYTAFEGMVVYHKEGFRGIGYIQQHLALGRRSSSYLYIGIGGYAGVTALLDEFPGQNNVAGVSALVGFEYVHPRSNVSFSFDINPAYELIQEKRLSGNQAAFSIRYLIN